MKKNVFILLVSIFLLLSVGNIHAYTAYISTNEGYTVANYAKAAVGTHEMSSKGLCQTFAWECLYHTLGVSNKVGCGCCATKAWQSYGVSSSREHIPLGAAVYFGGSSTIDGVCGQEAGHVGIYIGNNEIAHAWSSTIIVKTTIDYVINCGYYYRGWGWQGGYALATEVPSDTHAPTTAKLSINKTDFNIGEEFTMTFSSDVDCQYYLSIFDYDTGEKIIGEIASEKYINSFQKAGRYTAYMSAFNSKGSVDSNWIDFYVSPPITEPPQSVVLSVNKSILAVGETIKFSSNSKGANGYTIGIYKDGTRIYTADVGSSFEKKFDEPGSYVAYVTAWNSIGLVDSNKVYFVVYNSAPSSAELRIDKETIYTGENIRFSCSSGVATGYTIGIYKDGSRIFTSDIESSFEKEFTEEGNYTAYVTAWNSIGLVDSNRVSFTVQNLVPGTCKLSINKSVVAVGEEITFNCDSENATGYTIGINNSEGRVLTEVIGKTYTVSFSKPGKYSAYVTAWNANGISDSNRVYFVVYDGPPTSSELKIDKETICAGDSIQFTCISEEATGYTIGIHKDGVRMLTQDIDKVFTKTFNDAGKYTAYVTAWNTKGICDSAKIKFEVYDAIPDTCNLAVDKKIVEVGDVVNLKFDAHNAKLFEIVTYINGEQVWITPNRGNYKELELEIKDSGVYEVWANAYNEYGYCESEHITFVAYNCNNAVVLKNSNSIRIVKKLDVSREDYSCIMALYENGKMVKCINKPNLNGITILDETILCSDKYDEVKVMVWDSLSKVVPLCEAEVISSNEFIIE